MVLKNKEAKFEGAPRRYKLDSVEMDFMVNYFDTYAPVITYNSLRMFLAMMETMDYEIDVIDVTTAFLLSPIKEDSYIKIPLSYPTKPGQERMVIKLNRCLNGLKKAPMDWNNELNTHWTTLGFQATISDPYIYTRKTDAVYVLVYVDDIIVASMNRAITIKGKKEKVSMHWQKSYISIP